MNLTKVSSNKRRKFPRRSFIRLVGVLFQGKYFIAQGVALGEGGLSFKTDSVLIPIASFVVLNFQITDSDFISSRAEIRNHMSNQSDGSVVHGCQFVDLLFESRRLIRSYVSIHSEGATSD